MNRRDFLKFLYFGLTGITLGGLLKGSAVLAENTGPVPSLSIPKRNLWQETLNPNKTGFGFVGIGDMGTGFSNQYKLFELIATLDPEQYPGILLLGDISYPDSNPKFLEQNIIKPYQPVFSKGFRVYPVLGNHDYLYNQAQSIKTLFKVPNYYSFQIGSAQFWVLDTNLEGSNFDEKQKAWLRSSLKSSSSAWKIVCTHNPPFSSCKVHGSNQHLINNLCPLLEEYGVNLCLSGHDHVYERIEPVNGVSYVISGGGSASLYQFHEKTNLPSKMRKSAHHFLKALCKDGDILNCEAVDLQNKVIDKFSLLRSAHQQKEVVRLFSSSHEMAFR